MENKYIVSFSGGKDSTAMLLRLIEEKNPIDEIIFCDTGKEFPDLIKHICKVEEYIGIPVTKLKSEESFDYIFAERPRKSMKYSNVKGYGWPSIQRRWCTTMLKTRVFEEYVKEKYGENYKTYIGIAFDEYKRFEKNKNNHNLYPLIDWKMTERDCLQYCYSKGFDWGGLYKIFRRVSCYLCPFQRKSDWLNLKKFHAELFDDAIRLDRLSCFKFSPKETLEERINRWSNPFQSSLFDEEKDNE